jgi:Skp family chaperone for outer membrane proteins
VIQRTTRAECPATIRFVLDRKLTRYFEKRDDEIRLRDERWDEESRQRDAEARERNERWEREAEKWAEESRERWAELRRSRERDKELRKKAEAQAEETREFNREILLRNEKVYTSLIKQIEEGSEQLRANTQAVLSMLDRFNGSSA